jgi:hypothetical protein
MRGLPLNTPSTNNALESFNLCIKKEETLRERLPYKHGITKGKGTFVSFYFNKQFESKRKYYHLFLHSNDVEDIIIIHKNS